MDEPAPAAAGQDPPEDAPPVLALKMAGGGCGDGRFEDFDEGEESGTDEEQALFVEELERFYRERQLEFKPPKFYGIEINCLKLWREVIKIGGHDRVTAGKLWREVGRTFRPPKTCTTLSWTFRNFYEKALLDYERHRISTGELQFPHDLQELVQLDRKQNSTITAKARKDAATLPRWQAGNKIRHDEVEEISAKDNMDNPLKGTGGSFKRKKEPRSGYAEEIPSGKSAKIHDATTHVDDVGPPADWVRIQIRKIKGFYEIYALVPGLLREELQVQSDQAGRIILTGRPDHPDNPWGITPFKKVITFPACINPFETSATVSLHGQLCVRAPIRDSE